MNLADRQALFEAHLDGHKGIIFKVVGTFAWQQADQQDLAQEITLQLWSSFAKYDSRRPFATWMYQVALNTAISWSRKSRRRSLLLVPSEDAHNIAAEVADDPHALDLYRLIGSLDELDRALLLLHLEERTHAEIGEILGITANNVAVKLTRIKNRLRLEADRQP